jgi:hypothetical protein
MNKMNLTVSYRNKFTRTNDEDGSVYNIYCYLVSKNNNPLAIAQLEQDIKDAGHNVIVDEPSGSILFKSTRPIPRGCQITRTSKGKWIADTAKWDEIAALDKLYPNLGLGAAMAKELMADIMKKDRNQPVETQDEQTEQHKAEDQSAGEVGDAGIDPFKL